FIREFYNLVFDRWTVSWPCPLDRTGKKRRPVQILPYDLMRFLICISKPAGRLVDLDAFRVSCEVEGNNSLIPLLLFHLTEIDRVSRDPRRSPRLKPVHLYPEIFQALRQMIRALETVRPCVHTHIAVNTPCP